MAHYINSKDYPTGFSQKILANGAFCFISVAFCFISVACGAFFALNNLASGAFCFQKILASGVFCLSVLFSLHIH